MKESHRETLQQAISSLQHAENCMYLVYVDTPKGQGAQFRELGERICALWEEIKAELEAEQDDTNNDEKGDLL